MEKDSRGNKYVSKPDIIIDEPKEAIWNSLKVFLAIVSMNMEYAELERNNAKLKTKNLKTELLETSIELKRIKLEELKKKNVSRRSENKR